MSIIRNRTHRDRRRARQYRLERLAERMGTLQALIEANPYDGRFPSGHGVRGSDIANPTLQAVLTPDPIEGALTRADELVETAVRLLEDAVVELRKVETHDTPKERENSVQVCDVCASPCVPRARSHGGMHPLCPNCFASAYAATSQGVEPIVWKRRRMQFLAEAG